MEQQSDLGFTNHAVRFPSLEKAPGIMPWNPNQLDIWACELGRDRQSLFAAQFILDRWNPRFDWECGKFDPKMALAFWDKVHRRAFLDVVTSKLAYSA
jgi:hypothetical protein